MRLETVFAIANASYTDTVRQNPRADERRVRRGGAYLGVAAREGARGQGR